MAMTRVVLSDDSALADMKCGKKAGRAVPLIFVGEGSTAPTFQGQARLRTVERLDLAFLVHTEHHRILWRLQVHADHIRELLHKLWVSRKLERLC